MNCNYGRRCSNWKSQCEMNLDVLKSLLAFWKYGENRIAVFVGVHVLYTDKLTQT